MFKILKIDKNLFHLKDISEVNVRGTKQIQTEITPSHCTYPIDKGNGSSDISQRQSRKNVTASKKSSSIRY